MDLNFRRVSELRQEIAQRQASGRPTLLLYRELWKLQNELLSQAASCQGAKPEQEPRT